MLKARRDYIFGANFLVSSQVPSQKNRAATRRDRRDGCSVLIILYFVTEMLFDLNWNKLQMIVI